MTVYYLFPLLAFIPGSALIYLFSSKYNIKLSLLEFLVLGSVVWNYMLVALGYTVGVFSNRIGEFFVIFTISSLFLLICCCYRLLITKKFSGISFEITLDKVILLAACMPLLLIIFSLTISHSVFVEYDAIFVYLPSAKSIVETGGLQYDYYRQSNLTTAGSPAMPITYAWLMSLCSNRVNFDLAVRIFPLAYVLLTASVVYLITREVSNDSNIAAIGVITFLSMPVVSAIASNYSLYLDFPLTFLTSLGMFVLLVICKRRENGKFWWFVLGLIVSLMLLQKSESYLLFPSLLTLVLFPAIPQLGRTLAIVLATASSLLFTASYNILFAWDTLHFPADLFLNFIIRQVPIFVIFGIFSLLSFRLKRDTCLRKMHSIFIFFIPFLPVIIYLLRNLLFLGAITSSFPLFNNSFQAAASLINEASGVPMSLPASILNVLRWDILFTSVGLGAVFFIPTVVGLFAIITEFFGKQSDKKWFILLAYLLMLLSLWSWTFYCSYEGPELRRLYYFAPLLTVFAAKGIQSVASFIGCGKSLVPRFVIFNSLATVYLWASRFNVSSLSIKRLGGILTSLDVADVEVLIAFAFFFILSFYSPFGNHNVTLKTRVRMLSHYTRLLIPLALIVLLFSSVVSVSFSGLRDIQSSVYYVPDHWENDLHEVISYVNEKLPDNSAIVTCYALPISYFTNHPVIEVVTPYGIMNLLMPPTDDVEEIRNDLIEHDIRYLLLPKFGHSYHGYFENLSKLIPVLSNTIIDKTPYILLLKDFSRFRLFKVIKNEEASRTYMYLTFFEDGWVPLNNYSVLMKLNTTVILNASANVSITIAEDDEDLFWQAATANPEDELLLSSDIETKMSGQNSLKISVNGTHHMFINHKYETPQDWSSFKALTFYLYGANSSKPITITFHTNCWQDYYAISVNDDFVGWRTISIPLDSFQIYGKPSWRSIAYIEILLGNRTAIYFMDQIKLEGYAIGLEGLVPPITDDFSEVNMVLSIKGGSLNSPAMLTLSSYDRTKELTWTLIDGVNLIKVPSELLREGSVLRLYYHQNNTAEELRLYYLGVISST